MSKSWAVGCVLVLVFASVPAQAASTDSKRIQETRVVACEPDCVSAHAEAIRRAQEAYANECAKCESCTNPPDITFTQVKQVHRDGAPAEQATFSGTGEKCTDSPRNTPSGGGSGGLPIDG
jgi:hypothetical protein